MRSMLLVTALILIAMAVFHVFAARPASLQDCIEDFALKGGTNQFVIWGHQMCATAFDQNESSGKREWAFCTILEIPKVRADQALRIVSDQCYK